MGDQATQAADFLGDMMKDTRDALKEAQSTPRGTVARSKRERTGIWKKLLSMEKPELQDMMAMMASQAGHRDDEESMCEVCQFLAEQMSV